MSYFNLFPLRKDHRVDIRDVDSSKVFTHRFQFPDFYRHVILYSDKLNDGNYYYLNERIRDGERPDQLSTRLYGSPNYYWTFFVVNPQLRLGEIHQWPLSQRKLEEVIDEIYDGIVCNMFAYVRLKGFLPKIAIQKRINFFDGFNVGDYVIGNDSRISGQITFIRLKYGQIGLRNIEYGRPTIRNFFVDEVIVKAVLDDNGNRVESPERNNNGQPYFFVTNQSLDYKNAAYKYIDSETGEEVDNSRYIITDETSRPTGNLLMVTFRENMLNQNESLKMLRVLSPESIEQFTQTFRSLVRAN